MSKKAVIFDMDGVLIDSEPVYLDMFRKFLRENGCEPMEETLNLIAGASGKQTWEYMVRMWKEEIEPEKLHKIFRHQYPDFQVPYGKVVFPEVEELLCYLKGRGVTLALASSSSEKQIGQMMEETGFRDYFSCLVSGADLRESKPNPEIYYLTLERLGISEDDCLVVEDSEYGIEAAKAAGITVVAVKDHRFGYDQRKADYFIDRTIELKELFEQL